MAELKTQAWTKLLINKISVVIYEHKNRWDQVTSKFLKSVLNSEHKTEKV